MKGWLIKYMNQFLDNIYSYNRKLFRNIPLSSILFGLITILIFTKPQLIGEININNYISSSVQKILNHLANTIYNLIFLLIIFITICFIASILNAIGHKLPTFKKKNLTFNYWTKWWIYVVKWYLWSAFVFWCWREEVTDSYRRFCRRSGLLRRKIFKQCY